MLLSNPDDDESFAPAEASEALFPWFCIEISNPDDNSSFAPAEASESLFSWVFIQVSRMGGMKKLEFVDGLG